LAPWGTIKRPVLRRRSGVKGDTTGHRPNYPPNLSLVGRKKEKKTQDLKEEINLRPPTKKGEGECP